VPNSNGQWQAIEVVSSPFNGPSNVLVGGSSPNPVVDFDVRAHRAQWLKISGDVSRAEADIGFIITTFDGSRRMARSAPSLCDASSGRTRCAAYAWIPPEATKARAAIWSNAAPATLSDVRLEVAQQQIEMPAARARLTAILAEIREKYYLSKDTDWAAIENRTGQLMVAPVGVDPIPEAIVVAREMLPGHEHAGVFRSASRTPSAPAGESELPSCRQVDEATWVLNLPGTFSLTPRQLDEYIAASHTCIASSGQQSRWIIDLRANTGGNLYVMLAAMAPFLAYEQLLAFIGPSGNELPVTLTQKGVEVDGQVAYAWVGPAGALSTTPVIAWIGGSCGSSCEALTIALSDRQATVLVGQPTAGLATANESITLNGDYDLHITAGWMAHRNGERAEGRIRPGVALAATDPRMLLPYFSAR
jgi:carboxyl-terminal processing protease